MNAALELIQTIEANGGRIRVEDGCLVIAPAEAAAPVLDSLRQHKTEIIGLLQSRGIPPDDPTEWRTPFARWLEATCARDHRCSGGVSSLHIAFCEWAIAHDDVPCKRLTFECLLRESGFQIDEAAGVTLVSGLTFRGDPEAVGF
jgi:hypothetical protein